ncbi:phosphoribosyltransferase family protein [Paenarthrobacter sp. S56]|uniref:ComF family protein n=1 Tax=Paenarthrobacter sp. S56 TaxID=3138179 RepID=UPI00321C16BB
MDYDGTVKVGVVAAGPYREELAQALLSFKHLGQWRLAAVLAPCLAKAIAAALGREQGYLLVPVPSSGGAFRKRGFSPVHLLLATIRRRRMLPQCLAGDALRKKRTVAKDGSLHALPDLLRRAVKTVIGDSSVGTSTGQKGLGRGERARRVNGSMRVACTWKAKVRGRRCLIIDDVLTTGATIAEAARAVRQAGGIVSGAVVLAATRPPAYASRGVEDEPAATLKTQSKNKLPKDE